MKLKRYCVTVMDNWTPMRVFWTKAGATMWFDKFIGGAHLYEWQGAWGGFWEEITPSVSRPNLSPPETK